MNSRSNGALGESVVESGLDSEWDIDLEADQRLRVHYQKRPRADAHAEILRDFQQSPRKISPKYFYNSRGARLFDRITELPEYYLTRVERDIYRMFGHEMAEELGTGRLLIEPGSGSSEKVELLLEALRPSAYVPLEITESHLLSASRSLVERYPWLQVQAICGDYSNGVHLPESLPDAPRLLFFPGSTIGNFEPEQAARFLGHLHDACGACGSLLIGVDLTKDYGVLHAAYNDTRQITAEFNLNILDHLNGLLPADFDLQNFRHRAFFNAEQGRIEMHLESLCQQSVRLGNREFELAAGESIHTENSYKYSIADFHELAKSAGFAPRRTWCDSRNWFSVHLLDAD